MLRIKTGENQIEAEFNKIFKDELEYIYKVIGVQSALGVSRQNRLTDREHVFLVATVVCVLNGHTNPISEDAIQIYKKVFQNKVNKKNISDYIGKISKKKWILYDKRKKTVKVAPLLEKLDLRKQDFTLKLELSLLSE